LPVLQNVHHVSVIDMSLAYYTSLIEQSTLKIT